MWKTYESPAFPDQFPKGLPHCSICLLERKSHFRCLNLQFGSLKSHGHPISVGLNRIFDITKSYEHPIFGKIAFGDIWYRNTLFLLAKNIFLDTFGIGKSHVSDLRLHVWDTFWDGKCM